MDNPLAFPSLHPTNECRFVEEGMTLRDYFAAKAMQATINGAGVDDIQVARDAYRIADAMLKARRE